MRKEFWRHLTLSMCAMDPLLWSYYMASRVEQQEPREQYEDPDERFLTVVRNGRPGILAERRSAP
jgi:hypothetical protein